MHGGMHRWKRLTKANVRRDRFVAQVIHKIGTPIPLQTRRIQSVEHALQSGLRQRTYKIEGGLLKSTDGPKCFFGFRLRPSIGPNDTAHFLHVKMFGERRGGWNGK